MLAAFRRLEIVNAKRSVGVLSRYSPSLAALFVLRYIVVEVDTGFATRAAYGYRLLSYLLLFEFFKKASLT